MADRPPESRPPGKPEDRTVRIVLFLATVLLAGLVALASPLGEELVRLLAPPPEPLSSATPLSCLPGPWGEPWWRPLGWGRVGDGLGAWIRAARAQTLDPDRAARLRQAALDATTGTALATLATTFELRAARRRTPPPSEVSVTPTAVRYCPGERPLWELLWDEGATRDPWRAVVRVEAVGVEGRFLITDFDWGRVPNHVSPNDLPFEEIDP